MIIGLTGKKGSGKTTCAEKFALHGFEVRSFANRLKEISTIITGISSEKFKETYLPEYDMNGRQFLQFFGTNVCRNWDKEIWIKALFRDYREDEMIAEIEYYGNNIQVTLPPSNWVIDDVRFPNEVRTIHNYGGVVYRIWQPESTNDNHESETALDEFDLPVITWANQEEQIKDIIENLYVNS